MLITRPTLLKTNYGSLTGARDSFKESFYEVHGEQDRDGSWTTATSKMELHHKELQLGCCSSPRSAPAGWWLMLTNPTFSTLLKIKNWNWWIYWLLKIHTRLLGVHFDDQLKFDFHTEKLCKNRNGKLNAMTREIPFIDLSNGHRSTSTFTGTCILWFTITMSVDLHVS